ncbi:signal recognition particle receptor subunit beta [Streptomyces umbrinus]|uniref:Signal recognition particle receptor subunit beta n=1 Tax=Streptomyces umbrinus TaxID=67370 RepID=A0ABU0T6R7_9ACTN|nr:ATP/GTP-binding protein [Streptomyces umbrinus]MDQ1031487.1 signal recognition particle receptor subunit beta [Streptomyces umbrinus]
MTNQRPADALPGVGRAVVKILVAGGFGVGKTTLIRAVSEITPLTTEEALTQASTPTDSLQGVENKTTTTVALDFGRITFDVPQPIEMFLFGTPGQSRFRPIWDDLASGAIGAVVLADTRRLETSFDAVTHFETRNIPFVVAVNEFEDDPERYPADEIRHALRLDDGVPVLTCDARRDRSAARVLIALVDHALSTRFAKTAALDLHS